MPENPTKNPIVAFFRLQEFGYASPIFFSMDGKVFNPSAQPGEVSLIVLEDTVAVPSDLPHTNKNLDKPLGVIWHNETDDKKEALSVYGKPTTIVPAFSHVPGPIFDQIKAILEGRGDVLTFVAEAWEKIGQFERDELAAMITYFALLPVGQRRFGAFNHYQALLSRCEPGVGKSIETDVDENNYLGAISKLENFWPGNPSI